MTKLTSGRIEAFSDGVIAIIITIMVLELRPPETPSLNALLRLAPLIGSYALSFAYIGIYWINHHQLIRAASSVNTLVMWANLHLLFWLSLVPFVTAWMQVSHFATAPTAAYGLLLATAGGAFKLLATLLARHEGRASGLGWALKREWKITTSILGYALGVVLALVKPTAALLVYGLVAGLWVMPDRKISHVEHGHVS